jgi:hypothetical protein
MESIRANLPMFVGGILLGLAVTFALRFRSVKKPDTTHKPAPGEAGA